MSDYAKIQQGKYLAKEAMASSRSPATPIPVHGANGIIGWTDKAMYDHGVPLVTCRGSNCGMVLWAEGPLWVSNNAMAILPHNGLRRFAYYRLASSPPYDVVSGSAQPQITREALSPREYDLPPDELQPDIERVLSALDDKIELNRRMNETLEAQARALFRDWFVDFGPVKAKMAGHASYLAPDLWSIFPDRLDHNGVPEGWSPSTLSDHFEIIGGGTPNTSTDEYWGGDIPWFSVVDTPARGDVYVIDTEKSVSLAGVENSSARIVRKGTTIISARGTVGNLAIAAQEMTFNQSCYGLQGRDGAGDGFVFLAAQHMVNRLQAMAHGSVFSTITRDTFAGIQLVRPQPEIRNAFEDCVTPWFDKILANLLESRTLARTRDLLLPKLMSGEIRVGSA